MNHRDRGIIKYSPFLMPEHRKMLKELREKEERIQPSHHDEQQMKNGIGSFSRRWSLLLISRWNIISDIDYILSLDVSIITIS
ncbi:hypothetical protein B4119_0534 [Parageobacillus caldoxylosilyticus]|uniref:Uncharacterized protein n=1 Tax=Saccharococcus caldoxylosilyticus TaxID=81408 RepID=A0A150LX54_9BACL|nr:MULTISPECIES: hypothetical protein [Parageobacillus]KYD16828.1 hypothetical protein B4119_0534 [Parageobacillus caldoxylosilyticus]